MNECMLRVWKILREKAKGHNEYAEELMDKLAHSCRTCDKIDGCEAITELVVWMSISRK